MMSTDGFNGGKFVQLQETLPPYTGGLVFGWKYVC